MHGVVSLLDREHEERAESLWREIERTFGVRGEYATPVPHCSYHVAERYDLPRVTAALERLAAVTTPFSVTANGVGVFTGPRPVVYVPIARHAALSHLHAAVWSSLDGLAGEVTAYYRSERWLPHITLSFGDVHPERLPAIVGFLNQQPLEWEIRIDNLSLITDATGVQALAERFVLRGS
jgi:hypothetical protein